MSESKELTADDLLKLNDAPKVQRVDLENGSHVYVRDITGNERDYWDWYRNEISEGKVKVGQPGTMACLVCFAACDHNGKRLYTDQQMKAVGGIPNSILVPIWLAALEINGMRLKAHEDGVKNSESGQSDDSGSSSPATSGTNPSKSASDT